MSALHPFLIINNTAQGPVPLCIVANHSLSDAQAQAINEVAHAFDATPEQLCALTLPSSVLQMPLQDEPDAVPESIEATLSHVNEPQRIHDFTLNGKDKVFLEDLFEDLF